MTNRRCGADPLFEVYFRGFGPRRIRVSRLGEERMRLVLRSTEDLRDVSCRDTEGRHYRAWGIAGCRADPSVTPIAEARRFRPCHLILYPVKPRCGLLAMMG